MTEEDPFAVFAATQPTEEAAPKKRGRPAKPEAVEPARKKREPKEVAPIDYSVPLHALEHLRVMDDAEMKSFTAIYGKLLADTKKSREKVTAALAKIIL